MRMKVSSLFLLIILHFTIPCRQVSAQGTFVNLDFESPILPLIPDIFGNVPLEDALPGWTGYVGGYQTASVRYNNISLGTAEISFHGPGSRESPYHGQFCVFLQGGYGPFGGIVPSSIAQVGEIPTPARSLLFYANNLSLLQVTFAGESLPVFNLTGGIYGYQEFGADVSSLAGRTGELRFTGGSGNLDYIQFSDQPLVVPEPGACALVALGAAGAVWRRRKRP